MARTVGHFAMEDGVAFVALDRSEFADASYLTATGASATLSEHEFGYTLACYCWLRGEREEPPWARYLDVGVHRHVKQGLAYLAQVGCGAGLTTQRIVGRTLKYGTTTICGTCSRKIRATGRPPGKGIRPYFQTEPDNQVAQETCWYS